MRRLLIALGFFCLLTTLAGAVDLGPVEQSERLAGDLRDQLARIQTDLGRAGQTKDALGTSRTTAEEIRQRAIETLATLKAPANDIAQQLAKLGPPPAAGSADPLAGERKSLLDLQARHFNARAKLDLVVVESDQLVVRVANRLQDRFLEEVFEPSHSVLYPSLWIEGGRVMVQLWQRAQALLTTWQQQVVPESGPAIFYLFPIVVLAILALGLLMQRYFSGVIERRFALEAPSDLAKFARLLVRPLTWLAALLVAISVIYIAANALNVLTERASDLLDILLDALVTLAMASSFWWGVLSPRQPAWRLVRIDDATAFRLAQIGIVVTGVLVTRDMLRHIGRLLYLPVEFTVFVGALSSLALAGLLVLLLRLADPVLAANSTPPPGQRPAFFWARHARVPAVVVVIFAAGALLLGYIAFADFVTSQFFETFNLLAILHVLHRLADAFIASQISSGRATGRLARRTFYLTDRGLDRLRIGLRTLADIALVVIGLPALLYQWTVTWIDVSTVFNPLSSGLKIGELSISLSGLIVAFAVLVAGLFATNLFTRWLDRRIISETLLDPGVKNSIHKGAQYASYVLVIGFALSAAGLDFSNIALVAGALGVGIGLGLQSIVNNFVSGLILLAERPIKVGDWIEVAGGEGLVKRMNVRATEIEGFDSCTIIVPNSTLITTPVKNWTHDDHTGRFTVSLSVEYGNDPQAICDLLESLARDHAKVLGAPAPGAQFTAFGQHGMSFDLRGFVANVYDTGMVTSELRIAIDRALKERGIRYALPYPQPPARKRA